MIVEPASAEDLIRVARLFTQRKLGSSWNPTHILSAAIAAGAVSAVSTHKAKTRRTMRLKRSPLRWACVAAIHLQKWPSHRSGSSMRVV